MLSPDTNIPFHACNRGSALHGVTEFATRNARDFQDFGFARVWDPLGTAQ